MPWSEAELAAFAADFDHHDPRFVADPGPAYAVLPPVVRSGRHGGFWLLTRYEDVRAAAKDWRTFTSRVPNVTSIPSSHPRDEPDLPIEIDPPQHTRYRQLVAPFFTRELVRRYEPRVRALVRSSLGALLAAGGGDLVAGLAVPVSVGTLAAFMGLPDEDRSRWAAWVRRMYDAVDREDAAAAGREYFAYVDALVAARAARPLEDFPSLLLASEVEGERLAERDVVRFMRVLLIAGHETTAASMSLTLLRLAHHPQDRVRLAREPALLPSAVEEFLRLSSTVTLQARNATREVTLHGTTVPEGGVVGLCFPAANRDPHVFAEPERCVLDRAPNRHLAFGFGPHVCLGAHVARLELTVLLEELGARVRALRLAPGREPVWNRTGSVRGLASLPVELE